MSVIRVLVVDDDDLLRTAYQAFLGAEPSIEVVGMARNGSEALDAYERLRPDVVLMDLQMPILDGVDATRELCRRWPGACVCVLTTFGATDHIIAALKAGAAGYLVKDATGPQILAAVHQAYHGDMPLSPSVRRALADSVRERPVAAAPPVTVSPRELEVLQGLALGMSNAAIGQRLFLSEGTVKQHLTHVADKLHARSRTQILIRSIQLGLVDPQGLPDLDP